MTGKTEFARWLEETQLSRDDAARALGLSPDRVRQYAVGHLRGTRRGEGAVPPYAVRVLMRLIADHPGRTHAAWPATTEERNDVE